MEKQKCIKVENLTKEDIAVLYGRDELKTRNGGRRSCKEYTAIWSFC